MIIPIVYFFYLALGRQSLSLIFLSGCKGLHTGYESSSSGQAQHTLLQTSQLNISAAFMSQGVLTQLIHNPLKSLFVLLSWDKE